MKSQFSFPIKRQKQLQGCVSIGLTLQRKLIIIEKDFFSGLRQNNKKRENQVTLNTGVLNQNHLNGILSSELPQNNGSLNNNRKSDHDQIQSNREVNSPLRDSLRKSTKNQSSTSQTKLQNIKVTLGKGKMQSIRDGSDYLSRVYHNLCYETKLISFQKIKQQQVATFNQDDKSFIYQNKLLRMVFFSWNQFLGEQNKKRYIIGNGLKKLCSTLIKREFHYLQKQIIKFRPNSFQKVNFFFNIIKQANPDINKRIVNWLKVYNFPRETGSHKLLLN